MERLSDLALNHYPRHVGDITLATFGLSFAEFGCYDRLLDAYYANESPLPAEAKARYRLVGAASKADRALVDYIVARYFLAGPDGMHNKRADEEIAKFKGKAAKASESASIGWGKRNANAMPSHNERIQNEDANAMRTHSDGNANQEPVTKNQEPEPLKPKSTSGAHKPNGSAAPSVAAGRATRLGDEWRLPPDWKQWAIDAHGLEPERVVRISLAFRDFWIAKPGTGGTKLNWQATWRNWVRKEVGDV